MTDTMRTDAVVLGSGFGGSLLATLLVRQGMSVALLDVQRHPRFAIGESSTPIADLILRQLVERYDLPELRPLSRFGDWQAHLLQFNCGCKRGFSYFWHGDGSRFLADAEHSCELLVAASSSREAADTHWYRADVDQYFAETAERYGVRRIEGLSQLELEHPRLGEWEVRFEHAQSTHRIDAPLVIDATGAAGTVLKFLQIGSQLDQLETRSRGVFSHFTGMMRMADWLKTQNADLGDYPYPCDDAAVHQIFNDGWWWQLRFENGITSFGFAERLTDSSPPQPASAEEYWDTVVRSHPPVAQLLAGAQRHPVPGRIISSPRLQRLAAHAAGEDWAALPNTVGFIDPLHSTGIAQTLRGVERLAEILPQGVTRTEHLAAYEREVMAEFRLIDRIVAGCYASLSDFSVFVPWSMSYFASATCYEQTRLAGGVGSSHAFLDADDAAFSSLIESQYQKLRPAMRGDEDERVRFVEGLKAALEPFNRVGLFAPAKPNMYQHTACVKPK